MSAYIKLSTLEYPRHQGDIRLEHPEIGDEFVCPETYAEVAYVTEPEIDPDLQYCYEEKPQLIEGVWTMVWGVNDWSEEQKMKIELEKKKYKKLLDESGTKPDVIG